MQTLLLLFKLLGDAKLSTITSMHKYCMNNDFYVYQFIREDGTPYYIGKGTGNRAFIKKRGRPLDLTKIQIVKSGMSEYDAHQLEIKLISQYGRKDLGTGILINLTNGGEGLSNPSTETRNKMAEAKRNESPETRKKRSDSAKARIRTPLSNETKQKISKKNSGSKRSDPAKEKMSLAKIGRPSYKRTEETLLKQRKPKKKVTCPHCKQIGGVSSMVRWHFNNCKHKGTE